MVRRLTALLSLTLAGLAAEKPEPARVLRILPLGEPPPFRQEVRDGVRIELEPEAGTIPPRQVMVGPKDRAVTVRLNLGRPSEDIRIPPGTAPVRIMLPSPAPLRDAGKPWLTLQPPAQGDLLAVVWRDPGKPWSEPRALALPDDPAAFPAGTVRVLNLLPAPAAVLLGPERVSLEPAASKVVPVATAADIPLQRMFRREESV